MVCIDQQDLGGTVSIVAIYSIPLLFAHAKIAIPFRGIVVLVKCAICGFQAEVNPRIAAIYGHRPHRSMRAPPTLWICDIHMIIGPIPTSAESSY